MSKEWPLRCPLPLEAIQQLLIQYLASGKGYDDASVAAATREGNHCFQQKDFSRALDMFGIAYEIGRLHYAYRPLLHDILLRRILCQSLLGRFEQALQECHTAAWLIPNEATCNLLYGVIYSKLGRSEEANSSFQQAVATCCGLRDLVDCLIAFFTKQHGFLDRSIRICTQVLKRSPRYPLALLVRGDCYKCNQASKASRHSATADYTALLELDFSYQAILCRQAPKPAQHTRADELLLSFHPFLQMQSPRPYASYALCRQKDPLVVASLVLLAVTKLRIMSSSGRMLRSVQKAYDELLEQRALLQRKVYGLMVTQNRMASPLANQVYGPIDPEHASTRRYRRYWMEQAPSQRTVRATQVPRPPPALSPSSSQRRQKAMLLVRQQMEGTGRQKLPSGPPNPPQPLQPPDETGDLDRRHKAAGSTPLQETRPGTPASMAPTSPASPASPASAAPPRAPTTSGAAPLSTLSASGAAGLEKGRVHQPIRAPEGRQLERAQVRWESDAKEVQAGGSAVVPPPRPRPGLESLPDSRAHSLPSVPLMTAHAPPPEPSRSQEHADVPSRKVPAPVSERASDLRHLDLSRDLFSEASVCSSPAAPSPRPVHGASRPVGEGWDDSQWLAKAMEFLNDFSGGADVDIGLESARRPRPMSPEPEAGSRGSRGSQNKLVQLIEDCGLSQMPEWYYASVDKITEVHPLLTCAARVEPHGAAPGLLGTKRRSYVVPKRVAAPRDRDAEEKQRATSQRASGQSTRRQACRESTEFVSDSTRRERTEFASGVAHKLPPQARARKSPDPEPKRRASVA